ncbi:MAG: hypothetical protein EOO65_01450, partial [Methanosarcinales archaeon]
MNLSRLGFLVAIFAAQLLVGWYYLFHFAGPSTDDGLLRNKLRSPAISIQAVAAPAVTNDSECPAYVPAVPGQLQRRASIAVVFGTRPEAVKMASVVHELKTAAGQDVDIVCVATGQHEALLDSTVSALGLVPDVVMHLMRPNQELTALGARLMHHIGCVLTQLRPSLVIVQGDTVTAAIAANAAFLYDIAVGHVEAGLRTYLPKDPFPEEAQRTAISALTTLHFAPTQYAADVLVAAGACPLNVHVVGNTVVDALVTLLQRGPGPHALATLEQVGLPVPDHKHLVECIVKGGCAAHTPQDAVTSPDNAQRARDTSLTLLVTMHRRENFGTPVRNMIAAVLQLLERF